MPDPPIYPGVNTVRGRPGSALRQQVAIPPTRNPPGIRYMLHGGDWSVYPGSWENHQGAEMSLHPSAGDESTLMRWMRLEIGKINNGIVTERKRLSHLLGEEHHHP